MVLEKCDGICGDVDGKEKMVEAAHFSTGGTALPSAPEATETQLLRPGWPLNQFNSSCEIPCDTQKFRADCQSWILTHIPWSQLVVCLPPRHCQPWLWSYTSAKASGSTEARGL